MICVNLQRWAQNFYPRSPCGERQIVIMSNKRTCLFLSTLSLRRATHKALHGGRFLTFLSTLSLRRATPFLRFGRMTRPYFYPRSPCGERLDDLKVPASVSKISIHALLAESDQQKCRDRKAYINFYPRSPCGERLITGGAGTTILPFLSTLSLRRATTPDLTTTGKNNDFYPRSPCGERPSDMLECK